MTGKALLCSGGAESLIDSADRLHMSNTAICLTSQSILLD